MVFTLSDCNKLVIAISIYEYLEISSLNVIVDWRLFIFVHIFEQILKVIHGVEILRIIIGSVCSINSYLCKSWC